MSVKFPKATVDALRSIGVMLEVDGIGSCLVISESVLADCTSDRTREEFGEKLQKFSDLISNYSPDSKGTISVPLTEVVENEILSLSAALSATTWNGVGVGSKLAFEHDKLVGKLDQRIENGAIVAFLSLRPRSPAEIEKYQKQVAKAEEAAEKRKAAAKSGGESDPSGDSDSDTE